MLKTYKSSSNKESLGLLYNWATATLTVINFGKGVDLLLYPHN